MHGEDPVVVHREPRRLGREVGLVEDDDLRPLVETRAVEPELAVDRRGAVVGVALGAVDHVDEETRALEVSEKRVTEADAVARAFDQAGHVGDGQLRAVPRLDGAEHGLERRERVVGHLGRGVRDAAQERRLAGVRKPCERCVGHQLQA